jgi:hypothetical protein
LSSIAAELVTLHTVMARIQAQIATIEAVQSTADRIVQAAAEVPDEQLPKSLLIDATAPLPVAGGFYGVQHDARGEPYRWTGPDSAFSFEFFLSRAAPGRFVLHFTKVQNGAPASAMRCSLDGREIPVEVRSVPGGTEVHGLIPVRAGAGATVLTFVSPDPPATLEQAAPKDARRLGVSFRWLKLRTGPDEEPPSGAEQAVDGNAAPPAASPPTASQPEPA